MTSPDNPAHSHLKSRQVKIPVKLGSHRRTHLSVARAMLARHGVDEASLVSRPIQGHFKIPGHRKRVHSTKERLGGG